MLALIRGLAPPCLQSQKDLSVDSPDDEAASDVDDGSSILGGATDSMGGDTNSPPDAAVALVLSSLGDSKGVGKKKMVRARRCGHCYHCSNKQLKKACLNSIKEPGQVSPTAKPGRQ